MFAPNFAGWIIMCILYTIKTKRHFLHTIFFVNGGMPKTPERVGLIAKKHRYEKTQKPW
jgi:hypothetical protein